MLRNKSEEERDRILAQFQGELDRLMNRQEEQKQTQRDKIIGKLAARKRLKEEMEKEQAVAKELDRITKRHVCNHDYIDFFSSFFPFFLHKADSEFAFQWQIQKGTLEPPSSTPVFKYPMKMK